ncbi:MAG: SCP2 sterol-binding domain-containing protein [Candidatus Bathyarchaeia archaeon]|jgi:putative sterol carrier protein
MLETQLLNAEKTIQNVINKINAKTAEISDYNKTIQFYFTDAQTAYRIKITGGKVEKVEKSPSKQEAAVTVSCKVEILQNILENKLGATRALITRKVTVEGPVLAIRELRQKVLGPEHNNVA